MTIQAPTAFPMRAHDSSLRLQRTLDLFVRRPPVRPLNLRDSIAYEFFGRVNVIQFASIFSEELGLVRLRQLALTHGLKRPPRIVAVVVVDVRRPSQNVLVKL